MQRSTFRLSRPLKAAVHVSFGVLLLTGGGWMLAQRHLDQEAWETIPRLLLKIHGGAAMAALLVLGALGTHVKRGWNAGKNRLTGALLIAVNAFLIASGYGLYYIGGEELREWLSRWHAWIGLGTFVLLPAHVIAGRLIIRRLHREKSAGGRVSPSDSPRRQLR
jgi:peptidoglycan/LPS O-acetylase OafA/YrhL